MELSNKFIIFRSEREHKENELHKLCDYHRFLKSNGVSDEDSKRYVKWIYKYQIKKTKHL